MINLFNNWHLKLIALFSAIVLWFFVVGIENTVYTYPEAVDVKVINLGQNAALASALPKVKVYLRVKQELLKNVDKNEFEIYVDLKNLEPGEYKLPIYFSSKDPDASILKVEPAEANIKLAPVTEKEVDVMATAKGSPLQGFSVSLMTPELTKVKIIGAAEVLDKISQVIAPVVLEGNEASEIKQKVTLAIPEQLGIAQESVRIIPNQIMVTVEITGEQKQKVVTITPTFINTSDPQAILSKVVINPSSVTIQGPDQDLQKITTLTTDPVDANGLLTITTPETLHLILPENISLLDPNQIVTISPAPEATQLKTVLAPVIFTKQNANFKIKSADPSSIKVTVLGPAVMINNLKDGDVTVNINLDDADGPGIFTLKQAYILTKPGIQIVSFEPAAVELKK